MLGALLSKVFRYEAINGGERCPTYLHRWTLFQPRRPRWLWGGVGIYLHNFVGDDWSRDLHDHPKRFISIGLKGRYVEQTPAPFLAPMSMNYVGQAPCFEVCYEAPWVRTFPAEHIHRIRLVDGVPCWTLVVVLRGVREWGFWHEGRWIHWKEYVRGASSWIADRMKACP